MTAGMLFLFIAFYSLLPTLPPFIKRIGGTEAQVGLATGVFMLSAVLFRPIIGGLLDRICRRFDGWLKIGQNWLNGFMNKL
jgi:MFS family permease